MAARVIHFGWDDSYRVPVLRSAGYEVRESPSLATLHLDLQSDAQIDAVIVAEDDPESAEQAADLVRQQRLAPVIVFRRNQRVLDETKFDRVYLSFIPPEVWLMETATLIRQSQSIREASGRLRQESAHLRKTSKAVRERSEFERARSCKVVGTTK